MKTLWKKKIVGIMAVLPFLCLITVGAGVAQAAKKSCYDCHPKAKAAFAKTYVHAPVVKEDCEACHKRHGFSNKLVLKEIGAALCYSCHKGLKEKFEKKTMHPPTQKGECTACHNPHASNLKNLTSLASTVDAFDFGKNLWK